MANKVGPLIKAARTAADFTQEQLAKKLKGIEAADISKAERGELELPQTVLKEIAKLTGVTQSSLINAAKESTYKGAKKPAAAKKPCAAKKPAAEKKSAAKTSAATTSVKVTAAEKKLLELYREADSDARKAAVNLLKGESSDLEDMLGSLLGSSGKSDLLGNLLGGSGSGKNELLASLLSGLGKK